MRRLLAALAIAAGSSTQAAAQRLTQAQLVTLLDSVVPAAIAASHVPGAVVAVVRNDSGIALRGYGFARLEDSLRADPERSTYRLASVAKLFVATTVLQRVDAGRLDLLRDIQTYVPDIPLARSLDQPITLRHLLTHTAGFDERLIGYAARSRAEMRPLGEYLADRLPDRGWAPGALVSYSNHGMALAAYVAEREAHESFASLAGRTVFTPLGMGRTYYIEPPNEELTNDAAPGYRCGPGGCERAPVLWSHAYPVGLAFSTAADMSRFMRAWLNGGLLDGLQVIAQPIVAAATQQQFTHDPRLPGIGFAFFEQFHRGVRLLTHAGGAPGSATVLALAPVEHIGVFVATNAGEPGFTRSVLEPVLDALLPNGSSRPPAATGPVAEYAGSWRLARYAHRTVERFPAVFAFTVHMAAGGDTLVMPAGLTSRRFVRVDSLLLQEVADGTLLAFRRDADGRVTHAFTGVPSGGAELPGAFERVPWYEAPYFLNEYASWVLLIAPIVLALWGLVSLGAILWRRWRRVPRPTTAPRTPRIVAIALPIAAAALFMWFGFGFVAAGTRDLGRGQGIALGMSAADVALLRTAWLIALAAIPIGIFAVLAWRRCWWNLFGRLCYSALTIWAFAVAHFMFWWQYIPGRW